MTPDSHEELGFELNNAAEYAGVPFVFSVMPAEEKGQSYVEIRHLEKLFRVDTQWCIGNTRRLPDRTCRGQMLHCLLVSHPHIKGVSEKYGRLAPRQHMKLGTL